MWAISINYASEVIGHRRIKIIIGLNIRNEPTKNDNSRASKKIIKSLMRRIKIIEKISKNKKGGNAISTSK